MSQAIDFQPIDQPIDFQPLDQSQPSTPWYQQAADMVNSAGNTIANSSVGQAIGKVGNVIGQAANVAAPLVAAVTPGSGIPELAQKGAPAVAQAEGQAVSDYGQQKGYPMTGAAVGTGISMIPDAINAYAGVEGLHNVDNPVIKGLLNTPQELGPEYAALDAKAGVSGQLPIQRGSVPKFPGLDGQPSNAPPTQAPNVAPISYPKDTNTSLNFVRNRIDGVGDNLTPQELSDHKTILSNLMGKMSTQGQGNTPVFAKAAQASSDVTDLQNANVGGRASLNTAYRVSKGLQGATDAIKKYGSKAVGVAGSVGGLGALYDYLKK